MEGRTKTKTEVIPIWTISKEKLNYPLRTQNIYLQLILFTVGTEIPNNKGEQKYGDHSKRWTHIDFHAGYRFSPTHWNPKLTAD